MGNGCTKDNENIYFRCRKEAAVYNDKLNSREGAAELLGVSVSSLADYELGNTKVVPVDKVVLMADLYNAPQLLNIYCSTECPIGCRRPTETEVQSLERIVCRLTDVLTSESLGKYMKQLTHIAIDGRVNPDEREQMNEIIEYMKRLRIIVEGLILFDDKRRGCEDDKR